MTTTARAAGGKIHYFRALDFYRFIAALFVVTFHYIGIAGYKANPNLRHLVDFFFVLSGFVMMHSYLGLKSRDIGKFFVRRFARIYPLHIVTLLAFIAYAVIRGGHTMKPGGPYDPALIVPNIFMVHAWNTTAGGGFNFPSWSISAEWFVYLLFPLFLALYRKLKSGPALLAVAVLLMIALSLTDDSFGGRSWTLRTFDWGAIRAVPSFMIGMSIRVIKLPRVRWPVIYAVGLVYAGLYALPLPGETYIVASAAIVALSAAALGSSPLESPRLKPLSDISYGIYMLHIPIGNLLFLALRMPAAPPALRAVEVVGVMGVTIIAAMAIFRWFEMPARNAMRRWIEPLVTERGETAQTDLSPRTGRPPTDASE